MILSPPLRVCSLLSELCKSSLLQLQILFYILSHLFMGTNISLFFVWDSRKFIHKDLIKSQEEKPAKIIFFLCYDNLEKNEVFCARVKNNRKIFMEMSNKIILFVILSCFHSLRGFYHIKKGFSFWFVILG